MLGIFIFDPPTLQSPKSNSLPKSTLKVDDWNIFTSLKYAGIIIEKYSKTNKFNVPLINITISSLSDSKLIV